MRVLTGNIVFLFVVLTVCWPLFSHSQILKPKLLQPKLLQPQIEGSKTVVVGDEFTHSNVTDSAWRVYAAKHVSFSSVQDHNAQWLPIVPLSPIPNDAKIWVTLHIQSSLSVATKITLVLNSINVNNVEGYVIDNQKLIRRIYSNEQQTHDPHDIQFILYPRETIEVFVGIENSGPAYLPLSLWRSDLLSKERYHSQVSKNMFIGAMLCLVCYFFFTYFIQRNAARFWFTLSGSLCLLYSVDLFGFYVIAPKKWIGASHITIIFSCLILLSTAKITHLLIPRIKPFYKRLNYSLPVANLVLLSFCHTYFCWLGTVIIAFVWLAFQFFLSLRFKDRRHTLPAWLYSAGLFIISVTFTTFIIHFLSEYPYSNSFTVAFIIAAIIAFIFVGIAIEVGERGVHMREFSNQEKRIANLSQFYHLFNNSVEGLYTSSIEGSLLVVNAAMCKLFGYPDEDTMLAESPSTLAFYAHVEDRELLLQDIMQNKHILGRELRGKRRDGTEFWFSISCQIHRETNKEYLYGSIIDVTEKKQSNLSLEYLATHDPLTGILNRREFERKLQHELNNQHDQSLINLLYLDLDRFKLVNDSCGHKGGDKLIKDIANILQDCIGAKGEIARLGGDEFTILCNALDKESAYNLAVKVLNSIQNYRFFYDSKVFTLGVSIGFLSTSNSASSTEQLISMADAACYIAKDQGRNQVHIYSPDDESVKRYESELNWLNKINDALENNTFLLYCQPYQTLNDSSKGLYYEVLIRMLADDHSVITPNEFLPTAERYNLGDKVDRWVIENTFKWLHNHSDILDKTERCNINLSGQSLANRELKQAILIAFKTYSIPYNKICFEITETMAIIKLEDTLEFIKTFQNLGCFFVLDDFGSGFSSYNYLKNLPVDGIKIDGVFITELLNDPVNQAMVNSIKDVANAMHMQTVAEFVEDDVTLIQLGKMGVNFAQGYAVSKPFAIDDLVNMK